MMPTHPAAAVTRHPTTLVGPLIGMLTLLVLAGCASNPATGGRDIVLMSEKSEIELGRELNSRIIQEFGPCTCPDVQQYVNRIGQELAQVSERSHLQFHFMVLDDDVVNAFALPGGYVYITRGMLAHLNSEAELAAVIGHEIGHVTARHSVQRDASTKFLSGLAAVASIAAGTTAAGSAANMVGQAIQSGYGREQELQADELGARYVAKVGYSPQAMLRTVSMLKQKELFERERARAEGREPRIPHGIYRTHPDNDKRFAEAVATAREYADQVATREDNTEDYLSRIDGLQWGPKAIPGVVRQNYFYNSQYGIKIKFPDNWRVNGDPARLHAISDTNDAVLEVSVVIPGRLGPDDVIRRKLGLARLKDGRATTIAGMPAYIATADRYVSQFGPRPVRAAAIMDQRRNRAYVFAGTGKHDLSRLAADQQFIATIFSFDRMQQNEADLARAPTLRVVRAEESTTMAQLAGQSAVATFAPQNLRLINGLYPNGEPQPGQLIKTVD